VTAKIEVRKQKFVPEDEKAIGHFIREGYVHYHDVFDPEIIRAGREYFMTKYERLLELSRRGEFPADVNGWAVSIIDAFAKTDLYEKFVTTRKVINVMKNFLGPDVALLGYDALWINVPQDTDPVLLKGQHTDAWTGTSINTIFAKTFFTDVDQYNGMSVCPGSHLQGMIPVRNRAVDPQAKVEFESVNLDNAKAGDLLIWHPLLVHSTTGHSDKNIRISITSRYTSTETEFSSQERALGYRTLNVGPMNQVRRLIGNDYLTPFRTHGGFVGIDRRLSGIYEHSNYQLNRDYSKYF
jgi:hypothetical protein